MLTVRDIRYILGDAFTIRHIQAAEMAVLRALRFRLAMPTPPHFQHVLEHANACGAGHRHLVDKLLATALLDHRMIRHVPSMLVSAAILVSNELVARPGPLWTAALTLQSGYTEMDLRPCVEELRAIVAAYGPALHLHV